jgi:hypothetical protein
VVAASVVIAWNLSLIVPTNGIRLSWLLSDWLMNNLGLLSPPPHPQSKLLLKTTVALVMTLAINLTVTTPVTGNILLVSLAWRKQ